MSISAGSIVATLDLNTSAFSSGINSALQQLRTFGDNSNDASSRMSALGGAMTSVGGTLTKGVTTPLLAIGTGAVAVSMSFESAMSQVQAISCATGSDFDALKEKAKELGATTQFSASQSAEAMQYLALAGYDTNEIIGAMPDVLNLAAAGGIDLAYASDLATDAMASLGLEQDQLTMFTDQLARTSQKSNTSVSQLGEALLTVGGTAKVLSGGVTEANTILGVFANYGIKGSESGVHLRNMILSLSAPTDTAAKKIEELGLQIFDAEGNMRPLNETFTDLNGILGTMTQEERTQVLNELFNKTDLTAAQALLSGCGDEFDNLYNEISNADGAAKDMADTMQNNLKGKITAFKSALEGAGIAIGENLLPALTGIVEKVTGVVSAFGKLPQSTQTSIVNFGLVAAAIGPVLMISGKLITAIGQLMPLFSGLASLMGGGLLAGITSVVAPLGLLVGGVYVLHEAVDVANQRITKSREEMSLTERAIADFTGKVTYSRDELENMGLVYKEFADDISPAFRSAVEEMRLDIGDFNLALADITFDNTITQEEANTLVERVNGAMESAKQAVEEKKSEIQKTLGETFTADDGVVDSAEQAIINLANRQYEAYNAELVGMSDEIQELMRRVIEEGYVLTGADEAKIKDYYAKIKQIELEALSDNSTEKLYAMNLFKEQVATLDADAASELAQQKKQEIDTATQEENAMYKTRMQTLNDLYQEANKNHDEALKAQIENEKRQLTESHNANIEEQQRYTEEIYQALIEGNSNLAMEIDRFTLERFSAQDQNYNQQLNKYIEYNNAVGKATQTGQQFILEQTEQTMTKSVAIVDKTTGQMTGAFEVYQEGNNSIIQNVVGYNEKYQESTQQLADEYITSWTTMKNELLNNGIEMIDGNGNLIASNGQVVGSMETVVDANGNVLTSIRDINGNPIVIDENTAEVISKLIATQQEVNNTDGKKANINVTDNGTANQVKNNIANIPSYKQVTVGVVGGKWNGSTMYATGTESAVSGLAEVAEYGPELIVGRNGIATLATGRQVMDMQGGETVYNARQTKEILSGMENRDSSNNDDLMRNIIIKLDGVIKTTDSLKGYISETTKAVTDKEFEADVVMDSRKVGEAVFPTINTKLAGGRYRG